MAHKPTAQDLDKYLETLRLRNCSPETIRTARSNLIPLVTSSIGPQEFVLSGDVKPSTKAKRRSIVTRFYKFLKQDVNIDRVMTGTKLPKYMDEDKISDVISRIDVLTFDGKRDLAIVEVGLAIAARLSDLTNMKTSDLVQGGNWGMVRLCGKGGKEAVLPLTKKAREAIDQYLPCRKIVARGSDTMFLDSGGMPVDIGSMVKERFGVTTHILFRHSVAVSLINRGMPLHVVRDIMRHGNISTTSIYLNVTQQSLSEQHARYHMRGGE